MNFGMSGFNLNDDYIYFDEYVRKFKPDVTIIILSDEDFESLKTDKFRPYIEIVNDSICINEDFTKSGEYQKKLKSRFIRGRFHILGLLNVAKKIIHSQELKYILFDKLVKRSHHESTNEYTIDDIYPQLLNKMVKENIIIALRENISPFYYEIVKNSGIKFIDLNEAFNEYPQNKYYYWKATNKYGHWNQIAHKAIGDYLAKEIEKLVKN